MQLIDQIAPLVNIIIKVFQDIGWFMMIMSVSIFMFANSFFIIAQNQIDFDELEEDQMPGYATFMGAIQHVFLLSLGEFNLEDYEFGNGGS